MGLRTRLTVIEMRREQRYRVTYTAKGEFRTAANFELRIISISAFSFRIEGYTSLACGERILVRLPVIGSIEAYLAWKHEGRAGFQFERLIRADAFDKLVSLLKQNPHQKTDSL
jgi:hypothetical protein